MMLTVIYALLMALICLRLMTYRRAGDHYRLLPTLLAYLLAVIAGSVPVRALFGDLPAPDISAMLLAAVVLIALCDAGGSTARLLPKRKPSQPAATTCRNASEIIRRYQP